MTGQTGAEASSSSGGEQVREGGLRRMGRDAAAGLGVGIGRLPGEMGQGSGEMDRVLARPAGNFQHGSGRRQHVPQYRQDRIAVARDRGRGEGVVRRRDRSHHQICLNVLIAIPTETAKCMLWPWSGKRCGLAPREAVP